MELCERICDKFRILFGGFLYLIDLIYDFIIVVKIGKIFVLNIEYVDVDYVVIMEIKGIFMVFMIVKVMNLFLVIIRKDIKVLEGFIFSMIYVSGNSFKVESMSLLRKVFKLDSKVIIIDDFMRGGGIIKGMVDFMNEFGVEVIGIGVFIFIMNFLEKMVKDYILLI